MMPGYVGVLTAQDIPAGGTNVAVNETMPEKVSCNKVYELAHHYTLYNITLALSR